MIAVSGVLIFAGYQLLTYGWSQIQGENAGFFDLLWPGRYTGKYPLDSSSTTSSSGGSSGGAKLGGAVVAGGNPGSGLGSPGSSAKGG